MKASKDRPNIVSVQLSPKEGQARRCVREARHVHQDIVGRLISWFVELDRTEQSIVLGQVEEADVCDLAELLKSRGRKTASARPSTKARRGRKASR